MPTAISPQVMIFPQISGFGRPSRILCPSIFLIRHIGYDGEVIRTKAPQKIILMFHDLIDDMLRAVFHQVSYMLPHIQANMMREVFFVRHALKLLVQPVFIHQETGDSDGLISLAAHSCYPPISISSCWPNSISKSNSISC